MLPNCTKKCEDLKDIVCGGPSGEPGGTSYVSLYRSIGTENSSNGQGGDKLNCMYYENGIFDLDDCSKTYATMCGIGSSSWTEHKSNKENVFGEWTATTITCFANKTRPSMLNSARSLQTPQNASQLWTGVMRSQIPVSQVTCCMQTEGEQYSREFNKRNLLLTVTTSSSANVGAIVGATLSIVAVVVVVVVVVLIIRKRGFQLPNLKKRKHTTNIAHNNNAYGISRPVEILQSTYNRDQEEYAEIDLTTMIDNEARNGKLNDAPESSDYEHSYFVLEKPEEEQYPSTQAGDQKSDPNTYNPYNKLSLENSSNYDHVGAYNSEAGHAGSKVSDSENAYNTTSLGNSYLKTSGCESSNAYSMAEESEDTYNHTKVSMHQMGLMTPENDYDAI